MKGPEREAPTATAEDATKTSTSSELTRAAAEELRKLYEAWGRPETAARQD